MADEVSVNLSVVVSKGGSYSTTPPSSSSYKTDMAGTRTGNNTGVASTTDEQVDFGEILPVTGVLWFQNLSSVAGEGMKLSYGTGGGFGTGFTRVPPKTRVLVFPTSSTMYVKADAGTPAYQWGACE